MLLIAPVCCFAAPRPLPVLLLRVCVLPRRADALPVDFFRPEEDFARVPVCFDFADADFVFDEVCFFRADEAFDGDDFFEAAKEKTPTFTYKYRN